MLCKFSREFPAYVEQFLDKDRALRRNFREETVTDILMGGLITAAGNRLIVEFPDEPTTGADMEWNFINRGKNTFFRILLQAKRIHGDGSVWTRHCYRELLYETGNPRRLQAYILRDAAIMAPVATYPLYIFYNSGYTCGLARTSGNTSISGVNIADGYSIFNLVRGATNRALRTSNKSLKVLAPKLFPLSALFCPPRFANIPPLALSSGPSLFEVFNSKGRRAAGLQVPPTPEDIRNRLLRLRADTSISAKENVADIDLPGIPEVSEGIPDEIQAVLKRGSEYGHDERGLDRWRVTFVSDSSGTEVVE